MNKHILKPLALLLTGVLFLGGCASDTVVTISREDTSDSSISDKGQNNEAPKDGNEQSAGNEANANKDNNSEGETQTGSDGNPGESTPEAGEAAKSDLSEIDKDDLLIVFLGDDQFANKSGEATSVAAYTAEMTGAYVLNLSSPAARSAELTDPDPALPGSLFINISEYLSGDKDASIFEGMPAQAAVAASIDPALVDYYVIQYGTEDFISNIPLSDERSSSRTAFLNTIESGMANLHKASPDAQILVCSPVFAYFFDDDQNALGSSNVYCNNYGSLRDYANSEVGATSRLGYLSANFADSSYMDISDLTASKYLEADGRLLTRAGRQTMAAVISHMIRKDMGLEGAIIDKDGPFLIEDYMTDEEKALK
ncbi:hypothetical protein [Butyrivibrio sp. MC2013]|uniref:hypothetical protein n=1 Tax=Butyrivibrio sp. MC2013 TaxID=1280686 RepID=UPI0003FC8C6F|nr:hypothetical protein [Butyrivibrio sp. MC2013]